MNATRLLKFVNNFFYEQFLIYGSCLNDCKDLELMTSPGKVFHCLIVVEKNECLCVSVLQLGIVANFGHEMTWWM